jgi:hypothetical protein
MPKTGDILNGLQAIVDNQSIIALLWHIVFYFFIICLFVKWHPSNRLLSILLCLPVISVAALAWSYSNPFNGTMFAILAILIIAFSFKTEVMRVSIATWPYIVIGSMLIAFGFVYPHFIKVNSLFEYLYASPAGLIPCPTLSILIGIILLFNPLGSPVITWSFIVFGLFYGLFGVFKLGVTIDLFLLFGSISLLVKQLLYNRKMY